MKKLLLFIICISVSLLSCEKDTKKIIDEEKTETTFKPGEGGLFIGSVQDGEFFQYRIANATNPSVTIKSGTGVGRSNNKALSGDCKFGSSNFGQFIKLQSGNYIVFFKNGDAQESETGVEINIITSKCSSIETHGVAW